MELCNIYLFVILDLTQFLNLQKQNYPHEMFNYAQIK